MRPTIERETSWGVRIATWTVVVVVSLVVAGVVASLPIGASWFAAGAVGGLVAGLGWASWACLRAWWRG